MQSFPQYRKLNNGKSYYKINSTADFIEIGTMGQYYWEVAITAKILPERVMIEDMLNGMGETYIAITAEEFEEFLNICTTQKQKKVV
ncbi:MAG: hypothetical protein R2809_14080 [Flavobacteriales bacterium]